MNLIKGEGGLLVTFVLYPRGERGQKRWQGAVTVTVVIAEATTSLMM